MARSHERHNGMLAWLGCAAALCACAGVPDAQRVADARAQLRQAMQAPVATREQRDQQSRVMMECVQAAELEQLDLESVQSQLGRGLACQSSELCAAQGFQGDDLYFPLGVASGAAIKQLPTIILGFDAHGRVQRVFTLRTD